MTDTRPSPIPPAERIEWLDILRGFAVIGVLYVNMHNFGADRVSGPLHAAAKFFMLAVFESKFFSLFSLLFGIGFAIQLRRATQRGQPLIGHYWRRLAVLFVIGWLHALIYAGDVVRLYAVLGFVLLLFRNWTPRRLVLAAIVVFAIDGSTWLLYRSGYIDWQAMFPATQVQETQPAARAADTREAGREAMRAARVRVFKEGSLPEVMRANLAWHDRWIRILKGYGPSALVLMLLGLAGVRAGIVDDVGAHRAALRRCMRWLFWIGAPGALISAYVEALHDGALSAAMHSIVDTLYSVSYFTLALAYAAFVALHHSGPGWRWLFAPLAPIGRMPLTVYVGNSVIYTTIFYGYGLGLYGRLGPAHIIPLTAMIFGLEVLVCNWWMRRFHFGPLEWLWRSATYLKWQALR